MELGKSLEYLLWGSVRFSIRDSVWSSIIRSVNFPTRASVMGSTWTSLNNSVRDLNHLK